MPYFSCGYTPSTCYDIVIDAFQADSSSYSCLSIMFWLRCHVKYTDSLSYLVWYSILSQLNSEDWFWVYDTAGIYMCVPVMGSNFHLFFMNETRLFVTVCRYTSMTKWIILHLLLVTVIVTHNFECSLAFLLATISQVHMLNITYSIPHAGTQSCRDGIASHTLLVTVLITRNLHWRLANLLVASNQVGTYDPHHVLCFHDTLKNCLLYNLFYSAAVRSYCFH